MITPCVCPVAQFCERHQQDMRVFGGGRWKLCRTEPGYYEAFQLDLERATGQSIRKKPRELPGPSLERLALYLTPGKCGCDSEDRYRMIRHQLAKWPKPELLDNGRWAVAVTTAPRKCGDISPCLQSLIANGWAPMVFAEPGCDLKLRSEIEVRENAERLGCWRNWQHAARTLLDETDAELILLVQDDTVIVPGTRHFLDRRLPQDWPADGSAMLLSLYTPAHYLKGRSPGCHRVITRSLWGACAMVFRRTDLETLLAHPIAVNWKGAPFRTRTRPRDPWEVANVDTLIGKVANALKRGMFFCTPSLSQHVSPHSSIGHGDDSGRRAAASVVSDWSIFDKPFEPTGDTEYDRHAAEWARLFGRPPYSISLGCWQRIASLLRPGIRVTELGSGLSTRLLKARGADLVSLEADPVIAANSGAEYRPLADGWYSGDLPRPADVLLVDGPSGEGNRAGVLSRLSGLLAPGGTVIVDDTHREPEAAIANTLGGAVETVAEGERAWSIVTNYL